MKRLLTLLLALMLLVPASAGAQTIVTSFYPIYLFTLNLTDGLDGVTVKNLTAPTTGCLHDYQLQISDMKALSDADAFLINGAGMEGYLADVTSAFPDLPVVDASQNVPLLEADGTHHHEHEGHEGHHHEHNAHIWLSPENACIMVNNLAQGLVNACPEHEAAILKNRDDYIARLTAVHQELQTSLAALPHQDVVTFHDAFPYFAHAYGLHIVAVVSREPSDALSPAELANIVRTVKKLGNPPLFTEPQYEDIAARTISLETGAPVYVLDPIVTGPAEDIPLTYYEDVMRLNMAVLLEALGE